MDKKMLRAILGGFFVLSAIFLLMILTEGESHALPLKEDGKVAAIKVTQEQKDKYHLKKVHAGLSFECVFCHEGQGDNPENFEAPEETVCLECHKSKQYLAERLAFMDTLKSNPHNSVHDGPNLYCDECHREHEPSVNMCSECHLKEINNNVWMRKTP